MSLDIKFLQPHLEAHIGESVSNAVLAEDENVLYNVGDASYICPFDYTEESGTGVINFGTSTPYVEKEEQIQESFNAGELFKEAEFDMNQLIVRNATLLGAVSRNGRRYTAESMRQAAQLMEGTPQYINHPSTEGESRDVHKLFSKVHNAQFIENEMKVRGDMHLVDTPMIRNEVLPRMEHFKDKIGNSIVAWVNGQESNGEKVITSFRKVEAIDLVTDPATNNGLFESVNQKSKKGGSKHMEITLEQLKKENPEIIEALSAEVREGIKGAEKVDTLVKENDYLKEQVNELKTKNEEYRIKEALTEKKELIEAIVAESELPRDGVVISEEFIESLMSEKDEVDIRKKVDHIKKLYETLSKKPKINFEQTVGVPTDKGTKSLSEEEFVETSKRIFN